MLESFSTDQTRVEIAQDMTDNHYRKTYWIFVVSVMLHLKIMKMSVPETYTILFYRSSISEMSLKVGTKPWKVTLPLAKLSFMYQMYILIWNCSLFVVEPDKT